MGFFLRSSLKVEVGLNVNYIYKWQTIMAFRQFPVNYVFSCLNGAY